MKQHNFRVVYLFVLFLFSVTGTGCQLLPKQSVESEYLDKVNSMPSNVELQLIESKSALDFESVGHSSRMVVYSVDMTVAVTDPIDSMEFVSRLATEFDGFVVNSNVYYADSVEGDRNRLNNISPEAYVAIRVMANRLDEAIDMIGDSGVIQSLSRSGQDVTREYTDVDSRLRNMMAAENQLLELMTQAVSTESMVDVFREITIVREQIEVLEGQKRYYDQASELAFIGVRFIPDPGRQPVRLLGWDALATFKSAIEVLFGGLKWLGDMAIYLVVTLIPIGLIVIVPIYFIGRVVRRKIVVRKRSNKDIK